MRKETSLDLALALAVLIVLTALALLSTEQRPEAQVGRLVGSHANAWNAAVVGVSGTSAAIDIQRASIGTCSAFGNTSAAATLTVQQSQNNTNFYSTAVNTGAVTGDFGISFSPGGRYVRLISNAAATITATIACH
jgi:hypothetical protein